MPANVETMFYTRTEPWHGLGTRVEEAPTSEAALIYAGLDWNVVQEDVYTEERIFIPGYKVNLRDSDGAVLGIVWIFRRARATCSVRTDGSRLGTGGSLYSEYPNMRPLQ